MAHVGQENALGLVGRLGLAPGLLQIGDVDIDGDEPDLFTSHNHRQGQQLHIHQRTVPAGALGRHLHAPHGKHLVGVAERFLPQRVVSRDNVVQRLADHVAGPVAEQFLGHRVPGDDDAVQVGGYHRHRAVDKERFVVIPLATELFLESLAFGDIFQAAFVIEHLALFIPDGTGRVPDPDDLAIVSPVLKLKVAGQPLARHQFLPAQAVFRVHIEIDDAVGCQHALAARIARHLDHGLVGIQ